jgi:hypothetical protein
LGLGFEIKRRTASGCSEYLVVVRIEVHEKLRFEKPPKELSLPLKNKSELSFLKTRFVPLFGGFIRDLKGTDFKPIGGGNRKCG